MVNNPSAEQYTMCPDNGGQVYYANYWYLPTGYNGSTDYFNSCANLNTLTAPSSTRVTVPQNPAGFQFPKTGNAYFGLSVYGAHQVTSIDYREYLGNGLKQKLRLGKSYCVSFYVSLAEFSRYASNNIGFIITKDSVLNRTPPFPAQPLFLTPTYEYSSIISDTLNWTQIQTTYTSNGTELFITLGNFRNDVSTTTLQIKPSVSSPTFQNNAYYYIDDVSVVEINSANAATKDTLFSRCVSDSVILGTDSTEFATYTWQSTAAGLAALSCTNCPNPIAKPQVTTKYYLTKVQCSATTKDSVVVVVKTPTTIANAGTNQLICEGDIIQLGTKDSLTYTTYNWAPNTGLSCTNCATPYANPNATTIYNLTRKECNVTTTSTVKITIDDCNPTYTVPNVFTPNYDGVNDTWGVTFSSSKYIKNFQLQIYDRWGLLVFSTNSQLSTPNLRWDGHTTSGEECTNGVYYYIISFEKNGETINLKGNLSLFR